MGRGPRDAARSERSVSAVLPGTSVESTLAQSRERIRSYLLGSSAASPASVATRSRHHIGVSLFDAGRAWLRSQPWVGVANLGAQVSRQALVPVADRHPVALVGAAALVGGLIAWLRPWRGLLRPALLAGVGSQIASRLIARMPVESMLDSAILHFTGSAPSTTAQASFARRTA